MLDRHIPQGLATLAAAWGLVLLAAAPGSASQAGTEAERQAFRSAAALLATDPAGHGARRRALDDYVLAPYLDYAYLKRDWSAVDGATARRFLDGEANTRLGQDFRREYLAELARRGDYAAFTDLDDPALELPAELRCQRVMAGLATGRDADARREFLALWPTGRSLPAACDGPINAAQSRDWLTEEAVWQRLRLAVGEGNGGLAGSLARQLPAAGRADGERLARAVADPGATLREAANWPNLPLQREAVARALQRLARKSIDSAIGHWRTLSPRFDFAPPDRAAIAHDLALYAAVAYRPDAEEWFERVPREARSEQLVDWQLRAALATRSWEQVLKIVAGLPEPLAKSSRPRYWQARALEELQRKDEARQVYAAVATEANFHGFLAADRIDAPYAICPAELTPDPARAAVLRANTDVARALELHAVGWRPEASRAFDHARANASEADRRQLLLLASEQGWHDRVVFALTTGDDLRQYALRFPLAERDTVEREATRNGLDPAWTYALIRAESAWQSDVRSSANAWGLMQLLPGTGQQMARQLGVDWGGTRTLLDPDTNIRLGTRYLAQQAERFQGSPWLASAAYNAGPAPVQRWLAERSTLPADLFIETIPYRETREYVARVLAFSVIYDWRLHGKAQPLSGRLPDPGRRYVRVATSDVARPVICPAAGPPAGG